MIIGIIIAIAILYFIVKKIAGSQIKTNDDFFEQHGVRVNFKDGTISIKGHHYNVSQVTGVRYLKDGNGRALSTRGVEIDVDDFKKPTHKITVGGWGREQQNFAQRLCIALRKAGGPNFYF